MRSNENQEKAITYGEGPLMIIAGPGSGKTYTVTERVAHLIKVRGVHPQNILVMTFSRAAAAEMRERFMNKCIPGGEGVTFGTFHSVFYHVLLTAYGSIAERYIRDGSCEDGILFDEMLIMTGELLENRPDILGALRNRYRWILIDEFQDIDEVQFDIVRLIAPPYKDGNRGRRPNITIVGDDDQSIYGFRGARPDLMLDFEKTYPDTEKVVLDINYRSTGQIVDGAQRVISGNSRRFSKRLRSARGSGSRIDVMQFEDPREEYFYIAGALREAMAQGMPPEETAVLFRNNIQQWRFQKVLDEEGIVGVNAMTFHRSKGLEFKEVWIPDVNKGIIPGGKAKTPEEQEEERRAFYVAMTRAKDKLHIAYCSRIRERKAEPSEYIACIMNRRKKVLQKIGGIMKKIKIAYCSK